MEGEGKRQEVEGGEGKRLEGRRCSPPVKTTF